MSKPVIAQSTYQGGSGAGFPHGIEAVLQYNDLVINNRRAVDRIKVTKLTGLADADIRDSREDNPGRHGERSFTSYYSGRTIVIEGLIQAGHLIRLRNLSSDLRRAFNTLVELPLHFNWWDHYDSFDADSSSEYAIVSGSGTISIGGGNFAPTTTSTKYLLWTGMNRMYNEVSVMLNWNPATIGSQTYKIVLKAKTTGTSATRLMVVVNSGGMSIVKTVAGADTTLAGPVSASGYSSNAEIYMRATVIGNVVRGEFFGTAVPSSNGSPSVVTHTLSGGDATTFGSVANGYAGFEIDSPSTSARVRQLDIRGITPGDVEINCKKNAPITIDEEQTNEKMERPFMVSVRASNPLYQARYEDYIQIIPTVAGGSLAKDTMDHAPGNLTGTTDGAADGKTANIGGVWDGSGGNAGNPPTNDYQLTTGNPGVALRVPPGADPGTATSFTAGGRQAFIGSGYTDIDAQIDFSVSVISNNSRSWIGVMARRQDASNFVALVWADRNLGEVHLYRVNGGTPTLLQSASIANGVVPYARYTISLTIVGNTITGYMYPVGSSPILFAQVTSASIPSSGAIGIYDENKGGSGGHYFDNFQASGQLPPNVNSATMTNRGDQPAPAKIRIWGPCDAPWIKNLTTGKTFKFTTFGLLAGEYLDIDTANRTVTDHNGQDKLSNVDSISDWIYLQPGDNLIQYMPLAYSSGSRMDVGARSAWL